MNKEIVVKCQTDNEYSTISSNQCSWCAAEFIKHKRELRNLFISNETKFIELYNKCLKDGSEKRKQYNHRLYGENIDNKTLLSQYDDICIIMYLTIIKNIDTSFIKILPDDFKQEFYTKKYIILNENYFENRISDGASFLASRHGQSFAIIPILQRYLVLDSHIHKAKLMTKEELSNYLVNENCGHTHITLIKVA